jgi:hypothetical protein
MFSKRVVGAMQIKIDHLLSFRRQLDGIIVVRVLNLIRYFYR